jgi:hypothetical protein
MHHHTDDKATLDPSPRRHVLTLPFLLAVGWLIYELTHQPGLAAMAMCIKFGWEDFLTARWLRRTDPDPGRGRTCCWIYMSSGLWKVAMTGLGMILLILVLAALLNPRGNQQRQLVPMLAGAGFTLCVGFGTSALTSLIALWLAQKHRVRLWLNGAVSRARFHNDWPPYYGWDNHIMGLLVTTVLSVCLFLIPVALVLFCFVFDQQIPQRNKGSIIGVGTFVSVMVVLPALVLKLRDLRAHGFFANHPADCWGVYVPTVVDDTGELQRVQ